MAGIPCGDVVRGSERQQHLRTQQGSPLSPTEEKAYPGSTQGKALRGGIRNRRAAPEGGTAPGIPYQGSENYLVGSFPRGDPRMPWRDESKEAEWHGSRKDLQNASSQGQRQRGRASLQLSRMDAEEDSPGEQGQHRLPMMAARGRDCQEGQSRYQAKHCHVVLQMTSDGKSLGPSLPLQQRNGLPTMPQLSLGLREILEDFVADDDRTELADADGSLGDETGDAIGANDRLDALIATGEIDPLSPSAVAYLLRSPGSDAGTSKGKHFHNVAPQELFPRRSLGLGPQLAAHSKAAGARACLLVLAQQKGGSKLRWQEELAGHRSQVQGCRSSSKEVLPAPNSPSLGTSQAPRHLLSVNSTRRQGPTPLVQSTAAQCREDAGAATPGSPTEPEHKANLWGRQVSFDPQSLDRRAQQLARSHLGTRGQQASSSFFAGGFPEPPGLGRSAGSRVMAKCLSERPEATGYPGRHAQRQSSGVDGSSGCTVQPFWGVEVPAAFGSPVAASCTTTPGSVYRNLGQIAQARRKETLHLVSPLVHTGELPAATPGSAPSPSFPRRTEPVSIQSVLLQAATGSPGRAWAEVPPAKSSSCRTSRPSQPAVQADSATRSFGAGAASAEAPSSGSRTTTPAGRSANPVQLQNFQNPGARQTRLRRPSQEPLRIETSRNPLPRALLSPFGPYSPPVGRSHAMHQVHSPGTPEKALRYAAARSATRSASPSPRPVPGGPSWKLTGPSPLSPGPSPLSSAVLRSLQQSMSDAELPDRQRSSSKPRVAQKLAASYEVSRARKLTRPVSMNQTSYKQHEVTAGAQGRRSRAPSLSTDGQGCCRPAVPLADSHACVPQWQHASGPGDQQPGRVRGETRAGIMQQDGRRSTRSPLPASSISSGGWEQGSGKAASLPRTPKDSLLFPPESECLRQAHEVRREGCAAAQAQGQVQLWGLGGLPVSCSRVGGAGSSRPGSGPLLKEPTVGALHRGWCHEGEQTQQQAQDPKHCNRAHRAAAGRNPPFSPQAAFRRALPNQALHFMPHAGLAKQADGDLAADHSQCTPRSPSSPTELPWAEADSPGTPLEHQGKSIFGPEQLHAGGAHEESPSSSLEWFGSSTGSSFSGMETDGSSKPASQLNAWRRAESEKTKSAGIPPGGAHSPVVGQPPPPRSNSCHSTAPTISACSHGTSLVLHEEERKVQRPAYAGMSNRGGTKGQHVQA